LKRAEKRKKIRLVLADLHRWMRDQLLLVELEGVREEIERVR